MGILKVLFRLIATIFGFWGSNTGSFSSSGDTTYDAGKARSAIQKVTQH